VLEIKIFILKNRLYSAGIDSKILS